MPTYAVTLYRAKAEVRGDGSVKYINTDDDGEGAQERLKGEADVELVLNHIRTYSPESGEPTYCGRLVIDGTGADVFSVPHPLAGARMRSGEPPHSILRLFDGDPEPCEWLCRNGGRFWGRANYTDEGCIGHPEGKEHIYEYTIQFEKLDEDFPHTLVPKKNHIYIDVNLVNGKVFYRMCGESSEYPDSLGIFTDWESFLPKKRLDTMKEIIFGSSDWLETHTIEEKDANFFPPGCSRDAAREREAGHAPASGGGAAGSSHPG